MTSRDPMIAACWRDTGVSRHTPLADMAADEELKTYNKKFDTIPILTITLPSQSHQKADYISLWRAGSKNTLQSRDAKLADVLLLHLHKSVEINKGIAAPQDRSGSVIFCSRDGSIHFVDESIIAIWDRFMSGFLHDNQYYQVKTFDCSRID